MAESTHIAALRAADSHGARIRYSGGEVREAA